MDQLFSAIESYSIETFKDLLLSNFWLINCRSATVRKGSFSNSRNSKPSHYLGSKQLIDSLSYYYLLKDFSGYVEICESEDIL